MQYIASGFCASKWARWCSIVSMVAVLLGFPVNGEPANAATPDPTAAEKHSSEKVLLEKVPHQIKRPDFGGEACLAMSLQYFGHGYSQDDVFDLSGVDPVLGRGCMTQELKAVAEKIGFKVGQAWYNAQGGDLNPVVDRVMKIAKEQLSSKHPVVFLMRQKSGDQIIEQFVLAVGMDDQNKQVILHDPNSRLGKFRSIPTAQFRNAIQLNASTGKYVFCMPMVPGKIERLKTNATKEKFTNADYAQHIRKLKSKLPSKDFNFVIQKPFVVVGDESPDRIRQYATRTVAWCVEKLKKDYFKEDPKYILDVWLFKNETTYNKYVEELWGSKPHTPFGYYSSSSRVLVMNIGRGTGTLVHEIVHPFIESNFPGCPSWFNEGLASLYEQCGTNDGKIWGYTNWRLRGLQLAIQSDRVPSFKELCSTTRREFYESDPGTNYSQARYLCYYLQEKGLLRKFYHAFVKNVRKDPTGFETLKDVLKVDDMDAFKKDWQAYVMKLRYGR